MRARRPVLPCPVLEPLSKQPSVRLHSAPPITTTYCGRYLLEKAQAPTGKLTHARQLVEQQN